MKLLVVLEQLIMALQAKRRFAIEGMRTDMQTDLSHLKSRLLRWWQLAHERQQAQIISVKNENLLQETHHR